MKEDITLELHSIKFIAEMMDRMNWTREQVLAAALYLEERDRLRIGRTINDSYLTDQIESLWK